MSLFIASQILAGIASLLLTKASFTRNDKLMRCLMLLGVIVWSVHNVIVGTPVAVLMDILFVISNLVGYYRVHIKKPLSIM
ncbi:YgjV family protein [Vibrio sp. ZSDE26]|uniref:YgjV family protein n=1 Tax=Vibrio amylolyticus TaxID=2847292 RepID=A0A9X1XPM9_9VIBR|nr:YgjV family protein [Vibrio amylolyticus]